MIPEIIYIIIFFFLLWMVYIYNRLVIDRNRVLTAWSDIDVQLKRRHDLIPKLVDAVRQYTDFESATMQAVTALRNRSESLDNVAGISEVEQKLGDNIRRLLAVAEDYPDLKASQSFLDLQYNLTDVENHIQYARRYYNGAVRNLNIRIESFPDMLVARLFNFMPAQFFDIDVVKT
ncbi:MAG: LemA family protein [Gammaproteobacteria bacterium]